MAYTNIDRSSEYFDTKLYTGTGATQSISGLDFAPDMVWLKGRSGATDHALYDSVRGTTKDLVSNATSAETTQATGLTTFGTGGFTIGALAKLNTSSATYASWNFKAGGAGVSNTAGTISSTVSANTTAGFSIVSFTGNGNNDATIGHGLGTTPAMIITKNRIDSVNWRVWHQDLTANNVLFLASDLGEIDPGSQANGYIKTVGSSTYSVFEGNTDTNGVNGSGDAMIAYCFADVKGYSKFGSYIGNGSADGTFVYTGFKPAFLIQKRTDAIDIWRMFDNKRLGYNVDNNAVAPNSSGAEGTGDFVDFLSNGFKFRSTDNDVNGSGNSYIYMAIAENPFTTSSGIPTTAR
jgi:hypothetical protein